MTSLIKPKTMDFLKHLLCGTSMRCSLKDSMAVYEEILADLIEGGL